MGQKLTRVGPRPMSALCPQHRTFHIDHYAKTVEAYIPRTDDHIFADPLLWNAMVSHGSQSRGNTNSERVRTYRIASATRPSLLRSHACAKFRGGHEPFRACARHSRCRCAVFVRSSHAIQRLLELSAYQAFERYRVCRSAFILLIAPVSAQFLCQN
jgi:hypothetical protein